MGNLHVRFLEGWAPAMAPGYSTVMSRFVLLDNFRIARHPPEEQGGAIHLDIAKEANYSALNVCAGSVAAAILAGMTPASKDASAKSKMATSITATFTLLIS